MHFNLAKFYYCKKWVLHPGPSLRGPPSVAPLDPFRSTIATSNEPAEVLLTEVANLLLAEFTNQQLEVDSEFCLKRVANLLANSQRGRWRTKNEK
jgi:hypothetical protein